MKVQVRLFAAVRQAVGRDTVEVELPDEATVADVRDRLMALFPAAAPLAASATWALDARYAGSAARVPVGAVVACIPAVSGG